MNATQAGKPNGRAQWIVPILLIVCVAVVAFWEVMASRSRRPFRPFQITGEDFRAFAPSSALWSVRPLRLPASPTEPNIVGFEVEAKRQVASAQTQEAPMFRHAPSGAVTAPILVRLVHGYNMCDCMRIKGYQVELVEGRVEKVDAAVPGRFQRPGGVVPTSSSTSSEPETAPGNSTTQQSNNSATDAEGTSSSTRQVWRLTSSAGQVSIWITAMIRAGDFAETDVDVRSMAFPRIGIPDDPRWVPRGLTWSSLRHPIRNFRLYLRAKWNSSRCDLATFLGLRQPAWANDELLTLVAAWGGPSVGSADEQRVTEQVLAAGDFLYGELKKWRQGREEE